MPDPIEHILPAWGPLQHCSREIYRGDTLYFGADAANRFDDPARGFGVLYLAYNLQTALLESVFRHKQWARVGAKGKISLSEVRSRMVRIVVPTKNLTLCDLASEGAAMRAYWLNTQRLVSRKNHYRDTQTLSSHIQHSKAQNGRPFDGVLYLSRNNPGAKCIALFDHAAPSILVHDDIRLDDHQDWPGFVRDFNITITP